MMDFFGTGKDVAKRLGLTNRAQRYPIDALQFVDEDGGDYASVPISGVGWQILVPSPAELVNILHARAKEASAEIRFGEFDDGTSGRFALVFGADGVHSSVRHVVFGDERQFARYLGAYVAAFHLADHDFSVDHAMKLHEETDRMAGFYPLDDKRLDATYTFSGIRWWPCHTGSGSRLFVTLIGAQDG